MPGPSRGGPDTSSGPEPPGPPGPSGSSGGPDDPRDGRQLGTTGPGLLVGFGLTGLVLGWLVRRVALVAGGTPPTVGWLPLVTLSFVAVVVATFAWSTWRLLQRRHGRLEPHHAVNRLVLAKASALTGALVGGGYLGYALSWLGADAETARLRAVQALLAGLAAALLVVASLVLERACRVREDR